MIELSGNSVSTLKWTILEQTLEHGGLETIAISISQDFYNNMGNISQESLLSFNDPIPPPNGNYPEVLPFIPICVYIYIFILFFVSNVILILFVALCIK